MPIESGRSFFWRSVLAAMVYGTTYAGLRELNIDSTGYISWIPMAALRFTCLLLVPTRYWPALVVGEAIPMTYQSYVCMDQFGPLWVCVNSIPGILYVAPIFYHLRKQVPALEKSLPRNMGSLLLFMLLVSLVIGLRDTLSYSLLKQLAPGEIPLSLEVYGTRRLIGNYLSILTVTPIVLWLAEGLRQVIVQNKPLRGIAEALKDVQWRTTGLLIAIIALLATLGYLCGEATHPLVLCGMVAALMVAAWRYGWQSAALVGAIANFAVVALMPTRDDSLTTLAQCVIAALLSGALLLGVRTTATLALERSIRMAEHSAAAARQLARHERSTGERVRQDQAAMLSGLFDDARKQIMRVMHDARAGALSPAQVAGHYMQFDAMYQEHQRVTEGLAPMVWANFGGEDGIIVQRLAEMGIDTQILPRSVEAGACELSEELAQAFYRLACDAIIYLLTRAPSNRLQLHMAIRMQDGHTVAEATLTSMGSPMKLSAIVLDDLNPHLGVDDHVTEQHLRDRAQLYDGDARIVQTSPHRMCILLQVVEKAAR